MNKSVLLCIATALIVTALAPSYAGMPFAPKNIIAIHIGPKNATFDETKFPDIQFFYTPGLKWTLDKTTGKPALLANWLNAKGLRTDEMIVLDKSGVIAFKNVLLTTKRVEDGIGQGDLDSLGNVLRNVVEKNKLAPHVSDKPFDPADLSLLGRRFPDFAVVNASGEAFSTAAIISKEASPKMIFFFFIPPTYVFQDVSESMSSATSLFQVIGAATNMSLGDEYVALLKRFQEELYGR